MPSNAGDNTGDEGSIPGSGRFPGRGHGNPLQYSCLENPMDRGNWWATVHRVTKSRTQLSNWARTHVGSRGRHRSQETSATGTWVSQTRPEDNQAQCPRPRCWLNFRAVMSKAARRGEGIISIAKVEIDTHLHYSPSMLTKPPNKPSDSGRGFTPGSSV